MGFDIHNMVIPSGKGTSTVPLPHPFLCFMAIVFSLLLSCNRGNPNKSVLQEDISITLPALEQITDEPFFTAINTPLYVGEPELKNVMPNSWHKITRLTEDEEQIFFHENSEAFSRIKEFMHQFEHGHGENGYNNFFIYQQRVGNDVFFRVLSANVEPSQFTDPDVHFYQSIVYKNNMVLGGPYNRVYVTEESTSAIYFSIDVIEGRDGTKGILSTRLSSSLIRNNNPFAFRNGNLFGKTEAEYYSLQDIERIAKGEDYSFVQIVASDCLVDPNIPLRYSLQNAFDNDPSTSFVENTDNNLMEIRFLGLPVLINKIALINGYAQNEMLYMNNNRIKKIRSLNTEIILKDNFLSYQFIDTNGSASFYVLDIFKGNRYNDTCLAEINIRLEDSWLFGDIDE